MATFEKLAELKTIELEATTAQDTYNKVESELVELVGNYVIGAGVNCLALGNGTIISYSGKTLENILVEVKFAQEVKKFSLAHIINTGRYIKFADIAEIGDVWDEAMSIHTTLTSKIRELARLAVQQEMEAKKKAIADKKAEEKYQRQKEKALKDFEAHTQAERTLSVTNEFYYSLGWLAKHAGTVTAVLPDYLDSAFTKYFGAEAPRRVVDSKHRGPAGWQAQWSWSFTISIKKSELVPALLSDKLNPSGNKVSDTPFVWDLVDNYGFQFGKEQDIEKIRSHVPADCLASFEAGFACNLK